MLLQKKEKEDVADRFAEDKLIPPEKYKHFIQTTNFFTEEVIRKFADSIQRDPGIVLGRLQYDKKVSFYDVDLSRALRYRYKVVTS